MPDIREDNQQFVVPPGTRCDRADKILAREHHGLSRSRWQKLFQQGRVWMDDRVLSQKSKLRPGDVVEFSIPPAKALQLRPVAMPLSVLFEDEDLLVLDKSAGIVVHPGAGTGEDTLVHGILHYCRGALSGIGGVERPGIVHRLDKDTSGVLLVAKSDAAFQSLAEQFSSRSIGKFYTALVRGVPSETAGTIDEPIGRHSVHRIRMTCRPDGRTARTDYKVAKAWQPAAQVDLQIHTGRTHQIRVHMKKIGHPLLGDTLYGYKPVDGLPPVPRVMLHARRIIFEHPLNGASMDIEAPIPDDFQEVMVALDAAFESR